MSFGLGIDIGPNTVSVAGIRRRGGSLALEVYRHYEMSDLIGRGEPTPSKVAQAVAARLSEAGVKPRNVQLGVSGRDAIIRYSHLPPMPDWRLKLLMEMEIADVAERTGEPLSADYKALASSPDGNLILVALAKDARVKEVVDAFAAAGVEINGAVPQPVATGDCQRFLGEESSVGVTLVLDIGIGSTQVALIEEGDLLFARSVALGGETDHGQLGQMVKASVDFAKKQLKRRNLVIEQVCVAGASAQDPGLAQAIGEAVGCAGEVFDPLADLDRGGCDGESRGAADKHGPEAVTAVGLALSAVLPGANRLNLLPLSVKQALEFRHRTVFLYVAAAVVAAALLASFGLAMWEHSGESGRADALKAANTAIQQRVDAHDQRKQSNDDRESDLRALSDRARAGYHLATLIARLGEVTPPQIALTEASLVQDPGESSFHFEFSGLADDAQQQGVVAMRTFKVALEEDPNIVSVSLVPQGEEGTARRFRLRIEPKGNPAPVSEE